MSEFSVAMARRLISSSISTLLRAPKKRCGVPCTNGLSRSVAPIAQKRSFSGGPQFLKPHPNFFVPIEHQEPTSVVHSHPSEDSIQTESSNEVTVQDEEIKPQKISLKDIPTSMRHLLMYKGYNLPVQVVIGKKGVDTGVLNTLQLHFRKRDIVRVKISKPWKDNLAEIAQELEDKSGGIIIHRSGSRVILFRGFVTNDVPLKDPDREQGWWSQFPKEES